MLGLVHVVRGDQDGAALAGQTVDEVPEVAARGGVHTARRLVQQEDRRTMDQRTAQRQTLTPPGGEVGRERLLPPVQTGPGDELVAPLPQAPAPHAVHAAIELEVLRRRQIAVERKAL